MRKTREQKPVPLDPACLAAAWRDAGRDRMPWGDLAARLGLPWAAFAEGVRPYIDRHDLVARGEDLVLADGGARRLGLRVAPTGAVTAAPPPDFDRSAIQRARRHATGDYDTDDDGVPCPTIFYGTGPGWDRRPVAPGECPFCPPRRLEPEAVCLRCHRSGLDLFDIYD